MIRRIWLAIAGLGGAASLIAATFAAHVVTDPKAVELLHIGSQDGLVHAVALIALMALAQGREPRRGTAFVAGWGFALGIVLFSGSLFALAAGAPPWLRWVTPFGGTAWIVAWLALVLLAVRRR